MHMQLYKKSDVFVTVYKLNRKSLSTMMLVYMCYCVHTTCSVVGSVMLTQTMATSDYEAPVQAMLWSNTAAVSNFQANYATMKPNLPKSLIQQPGSLTKPHAACVNPINGDFLVTYWQPRTFIYLFDNCGWIKKKIELPSTSTARSHGCAFLGSKLFYSASEHKNKKKIAVHLRGCI